MACVNVIAADTEKEAQRLATSFYRLILGLIRNKRRPLEPPIESMEGVWLPQEEAAVRQFAYYAFTGSISTVEEKLSDFVAETGVQELMATTHVYDLAARTRSLELIAPLFQTGSSTA
jgi:alkanesulfonate monooxygenase SsuD/methylene tetrahydromethanopterin reductase-like flavin-dependent oxidoreductase (luciferase family)